MVAAPPELDGTLQASLHYLQSSLFMTQSQPNDTPGTSANWNGSPLWPGAPQLIAQFAKHADMGLALDYVALRDWWWPRYRAWQTDPSAAITLEEVLDVLNGPTVWVPARSARGRVIDADEGAWGSQA